VCQSVVSPYLASHAVDVGPALLLRHCTPHDGEESLHVDGYICGPLAFRREVLVVGDFVGAGVVVEVIDVLDVVPKLVI
jgi:hypothetical protein